MALETQRVEVKALRVTSNDVEQDDSVEKGGVGRTKFILMR